MSDNPALFSGQLLLAMPSLADPNFHGSVILICEHDEEGALGLVVNRPLELTLGAVLEQLSLPDDRPGLADRPVYSGGPVENQRGFVVHDAPGHYPDSLSVGDTLAVTSSEDVLAAISRGEGPAHFLVALGYAGWGPGQLEQELAENAWLAAPAAPGLIFDTAIAERWRAAASQIGVDPLRLSGEAGHA